RNLRDQLDLEKDLSNLVKGSKDLSKKQLDVVNSVLDKSQDILDNQKQIYEETLNTVDLEKLERDLIREGLGDRTSIIEKLKAQQNIQKQTNNLINLQASAYEKIGGSVESMIKNIPLFGDFLSSALGADGLGRNMADGFRTRVSESGFGRDAGAEFAGGLGVSLFQTADVSGSKAFLASLVTNVPLLLAATVGTLFSIGLSQGLESMTLKQRFVSFVGGGAADGLREAFGNLDRVTLANVRRLSIQKFLFGSNRQDLAKILQLQTEISGLTEKQAFDIQTQIQRFARLRGVLPKDVIADIAQNTELFAKFAKDGGANLGEAAVRARELGLSLSTVSSISDTLLNFQSSIEAELKASLLIGRQLNLNRARELALAGDQAGLLNEIVSLVGSEAELNRMNAIERQALAEAIGVSVAELNRLASGDVEFGSSDVKENTLALKNLTLALGLSAGAAIGGMIARSAPGLRLGIMRGANRSMIQELKALDIGKAARNTAVLNVGRGGAMAGRIAGTVGFAGRALAGASGLGALIFGVNTIISLFRKNNNTQETIARKSVTQAQNFPVFSSEVLSGN
ncbi:MAG TPA: hypothetical protein DCM40_29030, partial [Maribacter sp.]|nr:hypothetical protein [Maribacter sp.]